MNNYNLPDFCFANDNIYTDRINLIKYGESGYYPTGYTGDAMEYNKLIGVEEYVSEAMVCGSMFGWDVPGADPEFFRKIYENKKNKTIK